MVTDDSHSLVSYDLHGHSWPQVEELAPELVKDAWERGLTGVQFIHGSRRVRSPLAMRYRRGGAIKWGLRSMLRHGAFEPYARGPHSRKHFRPVDDAVIVIALKPNPARRPGANPKLPEPDYPRW